MLFKLTACNQLWKLKNTLHRPRSRFNTTVCFDCNRKVVLAVKIVLKTVLKSAWNSSSVSCKKISQNFIYLSFWGPQSIFALSLPHPVLSHVYMVLSELVICRNYLDKGPQTHMVTADGLNIEELKHFAWLWILLVVAAVHFLQAKKYILHKVFKSVFFKERSY